MKFELKSEPKGSQIGPFRVTEKVHDKISELGGLHNLPKQEVVRQMIDFAIAHMDDKLVNQDEVTHTLMEQGK